MQSQSTIVTCGTCGVAFPARPRSASRAGRRWFCGQPCYRISRRGRGKNAIENFWAKVDKSDECWLWTGALTPGGYGRAVGPDGRVDLAHRISLTMMSGPLPKGVFALHTCDTPRCVRNDGEGVYEVRGVLLPRWGHLFQGTAQNNMDDMTDKGRRVIVSLSGDLNPIRRNPSLAPRGERNAASKVTSDDVVVIRERYATGNFRQWDLAREYGLSQSTLGAILTGKSWAHVGGPITRFGKGRKIKR